MTERRGNNEGSIYKRKDDRWAATVDLGYAGGKRKRKTFYGDTRREVADKLTAALRAAQQGILPIGERLTVEQFLTRWLADSAKPSLRPLTFRSYNSIVTQHLVPELGSMALAKLSPDAVQRYLNRKTAEGQSPYTVRNHHALLRRALGQA